VDAVVDLPPTIDNAEIIEAVHARSSSEATADESEMSALGASSCRTVRATLRAVAQLSLVLRSRFRDTRSRGCCPR